MKKHIALWVAALLLFFCTGCAKEAAPELQRYSRTSFDLFDTVTILTGFDTSEEAFDKKADWLLELLEEYHQLYDIYHDYTGIHNLKTVNDNAGLQPVKVDERILDLLEYCIEMYDLTAGMTNVAMGSVLSIWHTYREAGEADPASAALPDPEKLSQAAQHMNIYEIEIDREEKTVYLPDPDMQLDVGAVAKGYATEQIARAAEEQGWDHLAFSVGGNVRTIGEKGDGSPWTASIQNPDLTSEETAICRLELTSGLSLVTSGSYQRYYTVDGVRYHHIIHPQTLYPENQFLSVSIVCKDAGMADALSTAVFNMTYTEGKALIESMDDVEAAWVDAEGTLRYTDGFAAMIIKE